MDRIDALLRSPPHSRNRLATDGQQPSTSGASSRQATSHEVEQGKIVEDLDLGLKQIVQNLSNDDKAGLGPAIVPQLAEIFMKLLSSRMTAERLRMKMEENPHPQNVPLLKPPRVNDTIWNSLDQTARENDMRQKKVQMKLTCGMSALANMTETVLKHKKASTIPDFTALLEKAMTAFALLASANHELSLRRREVMRFDLNPRFARLCFASTPVTTDLFGDEVPKLLEDIQRGHKLERNISRRGGRGGYQGKNFNRNKNQNQNYKGYKNNNNSDNNSYQNNGYNSYNNNGNNSYNNRGGKKGSKNWKKGGKPKRQQ